MASDLAKVAYKKSAALAEAGTPILGVGAACSLATSYPKKGPHRAYIAAYNGSTCQMHSLHLAKGLRTRWQEEELVSRLLIKVSMTMGWDGMGETTRGNRGK
jgi:hypothetical protein